MKKLYKMTLRTKDLFNFTTAVMVRQYDPTPQIMDAYDSDDGQLVDIQIKCTMNEKMVLSVALSDYILRIIEIDSTGKEMTLGEKLIRGWI